MHEFLRDWLVCPHCHGALRWLIAEQQGQRIETAEAHCTSCQTPYPVREGIGVFLTADLPRNDLWEQTDSGLVQYVRAHQDVRERLLDSPTQELNPADLLLRTMLFEEEGRFGEAADTQALAMQGLYTPQYRACWQSEIAYVAARAKAAGVPAVDLASGRGYLAVELARRLEQPVVATDFSLRVLRLDRRRFEQLGLLENISLLAFDARRTPFKDGVVGTMTSNLGLSNIEEPGCLFHELRRVVGGRLLSIMAFYAEADEANAPALREAGLSTTGFRRLCADAMTTAGWQVRFQNVQRSPALPTPRSAVIEGMGIDAFPVSPTVLEWCVLEA